MLWPLSISSIDNIVLILITSPLGDASLWATTRAIYLLTSLPWVPRGAPHHALTLTFGQRPMTGRYKKRIFKLSLDFTTMC